MVRTLFPIGELLSAVQPPQATPQPPSTQPEIQLSSAPPLSTAAATQGLVDLNISVTPAQTSTNPFGPSDDQLDSNPFTTPPQARPKKKVTRRMSKDDSNISSGLLGVKSTIPKAVSLVSSAGEALYFFKVEVTSLCLVSCISPQDYLAVQDEFDSEFTR